MCKGIQIQRNPGGNLGLGSYLRRHPQLHISSIPRQSTSIHEPIFVIKYYIINRFTLARAILKPISLPPATSLTTTSHPPILPSHHHPTILRSNTQISRSLTHHQNCTMSCSFIHPYQIQSASPDSHPIQLASSSFQRSSNSFILGTYIPYLPSEPSFHRQRAEICS